MQIVGEVRKHNFFHSTVKTIFIEEPEAGLHPSFQSKLAEMFQDANHRFGLQFIIETHSEYLIRCFQRMTAQNIISPELTQIYYFHHPDDVPSNKDQCYEINIEKNGALTQSFGGGFFDESSKLIFGLYQRAKNSDN
jgi:predicted ATPase